MKLKTDEEYKKIDEEDKKREEELSKKTSEYLKEFDKSNKKWIKFIKEMPENIQSQIMYASPFPSTAVMFWLMTGDAKTRDIKSKIVENWREKDEQKTN